MDYKTSVEYITNAVLFGAHKDGLRNIRELLERLGNPQQYFDAIHVAGTNGKGSTCAMMESILRCAGVRTGLFTSPYLERFTERIRIFGEEITQQEFAQIATLVRSHAQTMVEDGYHHPTFFELVTACAFEAYRRSGVEIAVIETGIGGRLDSTNVLLPKLSVITSIGMDHKKVLGNTIEQIAREKAGIIKPDVPVVVYKQPYAESYAEILSAARNVGSGGIYSAADAVAVVVESDLDGQTFSIQYQGIELNSLRIGLLGRHQISNAVTAILSMIVLANHCDIAIIEQHIRDGLAHTKWPGRLELLSRNPYILIDGAHNPQGARKLRQAVSNMFPSMNVILLCGMLKSKDAKGILHELAPMCDSAILTSVNSDRSLAPQEMSELLSTNGVQNTIIEDSNAAFRYAIQTAALRNKPLVVAGSLYLVGAFRSYYHQQ